MSRIYVLLSLFLGSFFFAANAQPSGWNYARPIQITDNSGANLSDYQLKLYIDTQTEIAAGRMQPSGADIRFGTDCSGNTPLNYWIEGPMNDDSTKVWVKVPSIPANGTATIFLFFGNAGATTTSAVNGTFIGPHSATDSVSSGGAGGVGNSQRGFRFAPLQDLLVTSFGKREPTGTTRFVTLFDFATQGIVQQIQVSGPAAQYNYGALPSPVWLTQGTQYVLQLFQGSSDGYYFGTSSQIGQHLTYYDMRYCNSCTQNTFPTSTLTNYHYGYPDLWYYTRQNVSPAPTYAFGGYDSLEVMVPDQLGCIGDSIVLSPMNVGGIGATACLWNSSFGLSDSSSCAPTLSFLGNYSYVLTVTDSLGCAASDTVLVTASAPSFTILANLSPICPGDSVMAMVSDTSLSYVWSPNGSISSSTGTSIFAFPTNTTTYTVIGTDTASGCWAMDTFTVIVNSMVLNVPFTTVSICAGDSVQLSASGTDTYDWTPTTNLSSATGASVMAWPNTTTQYTVMGTDTASGCMLAAGILVEVNPLPVVAFQIPNPNLCTIDPDLVLSFGTPSGGTYSGPFVTSGSFSPSQAGVGTYTIRYEYTDSMGCSAFATDSVVVSVCIGNASPLASDIGVHPNPSKGRFTITISPFANPLQYQVTNMLGQVVSTGYLDNGSTEIDLSSQPSGMYVLSVRGGDEGKDLRLEITR